MMPMLTRSVGQKTLPSTADRNGVMLIDDYAKIRKNNSSSQCFPPLVTKTSFIPTRLVIQRARHGTNSILSMQLPVKRYL